jgi:hypothetical protein
MASSDTRDCWVCAREELCRWTLLERELDDDLRAYQQMLVEEKRASGLSEEDAVRETSLEIGPFQALKENVWEARNGLDAENDVA